MKSTLTKEKLDEIVDKSLTDEKQLRQIDDLADTALTNIIVARRLMVQAENLFFGLELMDIHDSYLATAYGKANEAMAWLLMVREELALLIELDEEEREEREDDDE